MSAIKQPTTLFAALILGVALTGCGGGSGGGSNGGNGGSADSEPPFEAADGFAQKGPFRAGGTAILTALSDDGTAAGDSVSTTIGEWGEFEFDEIAWTGPSLLTVEGDWFDESTGDYAGESLTLRSVLAIPESEDDSAPFPGNVNFLTHAMTEYVLQEMGEGTSFDDAVADTLERLDDELNVPADPRHLNLFAREYDDERLTQASGLLVNASIAAAERGDMAAFITAIEDAAGEFGDGLADTWQALLKEAATLDGEGELEAHLARLSSHYNDADPGQPIWHAGSYGMIVSCARGQRDEHNHHRLCLNETTEFTLEQGESRVFWFEAPHEGAFRFSTSGTFYEESALYTQLTDSGEPSGTPRQQCNEHCNSTIASRILGEETRRYVRITATEDSSTTSYSITPQRVNEGSSSNPYRLFPEDNLAPTLTSESYSRFTGSTAEPSFVGGTSSFNNHSYYRFQLDHGHEAVRIYQNPCSDTGIYGAAISAELYRAPASDPVAAWDSDNIVDSAGDAYGCEIDLELPDDSYGHYYLKVANRHETETASEPNPTGLVRRFDLTIE